MKSDSKEEVEELTESCMVQVSFEGNLPVDTGGIHENGAWVCAVPKTPFSCHPGHLQDPPFSTSQFSRTLLLPPNLKFLEIFKLQKFKISRGKFERLDFGQSSTHKGTLC